MRPIFFDTNSEKGGAITTYILQLMAEGKSDREIHRLTTVSRPTLKKVRARNSEKITQLKEEQGNE